MRTRAGELFEPRVFQRRRLGDLADTRLAAAASRARELLAGHEAEPLPDDVERRIETAIETYRAAL